MKLNVSEFNGSIKKSKLFGLKNWGPQEQQHIEGNYEYHDLSWVELVPVPFCGGSCETFCGGRYETFSYENVPIFTTFLHLHLRIHA